MQELETSSSCSEISRVTVSPPSVNLVDASKNTTHVIGEMSNQLQTQQQQQQQSSPPAAVASSSCCETGRPIMTDPHTGQTVCSCQVDSRLLSYPRLATALPVAAAAAGLYGSTYSDQGYVSFGADHSAFYSPLNNSYDLKDGSTAAWSSLTQAAAYYSYDPTMGYPYSNGYGGMDLNGAARRKNATKEVTSTLKAWLYEHRKNPYPTKGEKIMLAIITKMTLTQVSTWFANARRRLKKENKMTWEPRNRVDDDDKSDIENDNEPSPIKDGGSSRDDKKDRYGDSCNGNLHMCDKSRDSDDLMMHHRTHHSSLQHGGGGGKGSGDKDTGLRSLCPDSRSCSPGSPLSLSSPTGLSQSSLGALSDPSPSPDIASSVGHVQGGLCKSSSNAITDAAKPRIWSLAHTATSNSPPLSRKSPQPSPLHHHPLHHHQGYHGSVGVGGGGGSMATGYNPMSATTAGAKYNGMGMGMHGGMSTSSAAAAAAAAAAQYHHQQGSTNLTQRPDLRTWIEGAFHGASALTAMGIAAQYHGLVSTANSLHHGGGGGGGHHGTTSMQPNSSGAAAINNPCAGGSAAVSAGTVSSGGITSGAMSVAQGSGLTSAAISAAGQDRLSMASSAVVGSTMTVGHNGGGVGGGVTVAGVGGQRITSNLNVSQSAVMDARNQLAQNVTGSGLACRALTTPSNGAGLKVSFPPPPCTNGLPIGQTNLLTAVKSNLCSLTGSDRVGGLHSSLTRTSSQQEALATAFRPVTKT